MGTQARFGFSRIDPKLKFSSVTSDMYAYKLSPPENRAFS